MKKEINRDELLGVVKYQNRWHFFAEYVAWWILDYASYDPEDVATSENIGEFRNGLIVVDETKAKEFIQAMHEQEMAVEDVKRLVDERGTESVPLTFLIDFDKRLYVSYFYDLGLEDYVPQGWQGVYDNPFDYVSNEIRSLWTQSEVAAKAS